MRQPIAALAQGRWRGILPAVGVDANALTGKHVPCPLCGGKDRFRFDDKEGRGTWICSHCGAGDGVALVMAKAGLEFRGAVDLIEQHLGGAPRLAPRPERSDADKRKAMNELWRGAGRVSPGDPVALWLASRVGLAQVPDCLRHHRWARYQGEPVTHHPAMVAMVLDVDGRPAMLHRTFLTKDGRKAPVEEPRRLMPGTLPHGAAVRLFPSEAVMGVAEGIETAFAAASLFGVPVWAALTAGNLAVWTPPAGTREVVIFGDHDASFTGQEAAYALARRLTNKAVAVRVELPPVCGQDWNDVYLNREIAA